MFVSHDRYFLDRVATSVIVLEAGNWKYYEGNYSDLCELQKKPRRGNRRRGPEIRRETNSPPPKPEAPKSDGGKKKETKRKRKFPYRKVADLEAEIAEYEDLVERLQTDLADPEILRDGDRVKETMEAFEDAQQHLEELYEHWEEAVELN